MIKGLLLASSVFVASAAGLAELQPGTPAPEFPSKAIWLGPGTPLSMRQLRGKVVIVDFWEYTCINCIRTFPHFKKLYARYHDAGLEIVGVHKGEFAFAAEEKNVARAYARFELPYPGIADVKDAIWKAYGCDTWPDTFVIDRAGVIRGAHGGEGDYAALEHLVQQLLKDGHPELDFSSVAVPRDTPLVGPECGPMSDEIMVGALRGSARGFHVEGNWKKRPDDFESAEDPRPDRRISLGIAYRGREVYAVLDRGTRDPVEMVVTRDGSPVPEPLRGKDVKARPDGQTVVVIDEPRMYYVIAGEDDTRPHELVFLPSEKGARICSFTFGNRCLENFGKL